MDRLQKLFGLLRPLCGLSEASRQPAGLLRPLCGLSEACLLSSYGLPKATLGILDRLQKPLGSRQASCGLSVACAKPASSLLMGFRRQREAFWTGFKSLSAAGRPLAASLWPVRSLPPLFLWASEGNVRHFGPASKASRQPAGLLRPLCGLSEACLLSSYGLPKATLGILARLQTLPRASPQPCPLLGSWQACLFSSYGLPKATLGILARLQTLPKASPQPCPLLGKLPKATFRHFGPPSKAFRPLAASLWPVRSFSAAGRPLAASLWPVRSLPPLFLWASEGNVRHFGPASKASRQPAGLLRPLCGLSEACLLSSYGLPKATLGILARLQTLPRASPQPCPLLGSWQACLFSSYGLPKATLGILARLQTLPRASPQPCPLLGRLPKATFRHFGPPSKAFRPLAASLWPVRSFSAAGRPLAASLWPVRSLPPLFLWASEGNVRHFGPASKASRQPAGLLRPLCGLSEACLLSSYGLPKATLGILDRLQKPLGSRQASCGLSVACPKPASSLLMGFRRQR